MLFSLDLRFHTFRGHLGCSCLDSIRWVGGQGGDGRGEPTTGPVLVQTLTHTYRYRRAEAGHPEQFRRPGVGAPVLSACH